MQDLSRRGARRLAMLQATKRFEEDQDQLGPGERTSIGKRQRTERPDTPQDAFLGDFDFEYDGDGPYDVGFFLFLGSIF